MSVISCTVLVAVVECSFAEIIELGSHFVGERSRFIISLAMQTWFVAAFTAVDDGEQTQWVKLSSV